MLLLSLYRFIRHFSSRRFAPLPPVQPIAHHRRQQLALFSEQNNGSLTPTQWPHFSTPPELSPYESSLSLPPSKEVDTLSQPVSPLQPSFYSGENSLTESSSNGQLDHRRIPKLSRPDDHRRNSVGSVGSTHFARPSTAHSSSSTPPTNTHLPHRHRLHSIASHTSIASRSSGGLPHGPHSQVKIVLPALLAPSLMPSNTGSTENILFPVAPDARQNRGSVRLSVADMWAPSLHRTASDDQITPSSTRGRLSKSASPSRQRSRLVRPTSANNGSRAPSPLSSELLSTASLAPSVPAETPLSAQPLQAPAS